MTARNILIRGLLAGLIAGLFTFIVAHQIGEPQIDTAIALEEAGAAVAETPAVDQAEHSHADEGTEVSRENQSTWGLLTGTLLVGTALGGIVAVAAAFAVGRLGALRPGQSTAVVALVGFVSVSLVPFLKYPATPPAVGSGDTIGSRTGLYFTYMLISVLAAILAVLLARQILPSRGAYPAIVISAAVYLVIVVVAGMIMPTVNEIGAFPADTLWYFRRDSLFTLATTWAVIGVILTGLVGKLAKEEKFARQAVTVGA